jgi:hypothetical protein
VPGLVLRFLWLCERVLRASVRACLRAVHRSIEGVNRTLAGSCGRFVSDCSVPAAAPVRTHEMCLPLT